MNLNYPVSDIAKWINAKVVGNSDEIVHHVSFDSRSPLNNSSTLFFAVQGNYRHGHDYISDFVAKGGRMMVVEKEQDVNNCVQLVVENSITALQLLAQKHRQQYNIPVIGITGSNGKTTVKEWLFHILKDHFIVIRSPKSYNSQIGVPLSILEITNSHQIAIIEAGISFPGEMIKLEKIIKPTIGIFTGIGLAHQINFSSLEEKESEKMKLFNNVETLLTPTKLNLVSVNQIPFNNPASILNASLAKTAALHLGLSESEVDKALLSLPYVSMRMEQMEGANGNVLINDTYTFDEKGLEVSLKSLNQIGIDKQKVAILAPDPSYKSGTSLRKILNASGINILIWISAEEVPNNLNCETLHIQSVNQFIREPMEFFNSVILFSGARSMELERCIPVYQLKKHVTKLEINLAAIRKNLGFYKSKLTENTKILAMVKAQSYGGGSVEMAKFLAREEVDALGVAYADEGVALVKEGIHLPILVMNPEQAAFDDIIDYQLEPSMYSLPILDQFIRQLILKGKKRVPIHIKLDSGMHRLGFLPIHITELISVLNSQPEVYVKAVFSHLADADNLNDSGFTKQQISVFNEMCQQIEKGIGYSFIKHLSNTEGIVNYPESHFDLVRIGIGLFGLGGQKSPLLQEALAFKSQISQIKNITKGDTVGYGRIFKANENMVIGIIPVGYADGLSRALSNGAWRMKINEVFVPIIGSICMDMCMVDLTKVTCSEGDEIEVFGWENSISDMAIKLNTIPYEIISSISSRVHRLYID